MGVCYSCIDSGIDVREPNLDLSDKKEKKDNTDRNYICEIKQSDEIALLSACNLKNTPEQVYNFTKAKVIKVYDGDTITIAAIYNKIATKFSVRIYGVDCDEMKGGTEITKYNARMAKKFVSDLILNKIIDIEVLNGKIINGRKVNEKFGRLLANVKIDGKDLADELIRNNLARPYFGGTKGGKVLNPKKHHTSI
jgi:endonuclease YncB( thermonuclease family)